MNFGGLSGVDILFFRVLVSAGWLAVDAVLISIFARYLFVGFRDEGFRWWYARPSNKAAIALCLYFIGQATNRVWGSVWLYNGLHRAALAAWFTTSGMAELDRWFVVSLIGQALSFFAALCTARIFAPAKWGNWTWIGTLIVVIVTTIVAYYFIGQANPTLVDD